MQTSDANQQRIENRLEELTSLVRQLAFGLKQPQQFVPLVASVCQICSMPGHPIDQCPELQERNDIVVGVFSWQTLLCIIAAEL